VDTNLDTGICVVTPLVTAAWLPVWQTVVSMETILETMFWKPPVLLLQRVLHRGVTADFAVNQPVNHILATNW
jgi:hypothetical protein